MVVQSAYFGGREPAHLAARSSHLPSSASLTSPFASTRTQAFIGRPEDDTGDVEFAFGLLPEFQGRGFGGETIRALATWAFANGAKRVISHLDAEDAHAATALARQGFADTNEPPYPGVARWALSAAA